MLDIDPFRRHAAYTLWRLEAHPTDAQKKPLKIAVHYDGRTRHSLGRPARGDRAAIAANPAPPLTASQAQQWLAYCRQTGVGHDRPGEVGYLGIGFRPAGTGLACLDIDNCLAGGQWSATALAMMARFPGAFIELSTSGNGLHIWFTYTGDGPGRLGKDASGLLELYSEGQFLAAGTPLQGDASVDCTAAMQALVSEFWPQRPAGGNAVVANDWADKTDEQRAETRQQILDACRHLAGDNSYDYHAWVDVGMALASLGDDGHDLWHEFSSWHPVYDYDDCEAKWHQLNPDRTDYRALFAKAQRSGWQNPNSTSARIGAAMQGLGSEFSAPPTAGGQAATPVAVARPNMMGTSAAAAPLAIKTVAGPGDGVTDVVAREIPVNPVATSATAAPPAIENVAASPFQAAGAAYVPPPGTPPVPDGPPQGRNLVADDSLAYLRDADGFKATLPNVVETLASEQTLLKFGWDEFYGCQMIAESAQHPWRRLANEDPPRLRWMMEKRGFKPIGPEIMKSALAIVCADNRFDSARQWAQGLRWDGVKRVETALCRYYGCADTPYTRAVSAYMFSALAGRAVEPGCQADMVPVLVGLQGAKKTTAVRTLAPIPDSFLAIDLSKRDDDLSRRLRGKLVAEWPELRGLAGRDVQAVRAWITTRRESWVEKYETVERTFGRRFIVIGTANEEEFLDDAEGERRWLPVRVGLTIDVEGLERDRDQLWAEGVAMFMDGGVRWRDAETLARAEHDGFKVSDEWTPLVEKWLQGVATAALQGDPQAEAVTGRPRGDDPFTILDVARHCLHVPSDRVDRRVQLRIGKILRALGFAKTQIRMGPAVVKRWVRQGLQNPFGPT